MVAILSGPLWSVTISATARANFTQCTRTSSAIGEQPRQPKPAFPDHIIARWQGREHIEDLGAYNHLTPAERLETLKAAVKHGRIKGQVADMYFNLKENVRDIFLEGQLQAVHVTPLGLCVHDSAMATETIPYKAIFASSIDASRLTIKIKIPHVNES
jgi:hypothetical protein